MNHLVPESRKAAGFGRRRIAPRACIVDAKPHIRRFLADSLEELGFIAHECSCAGEIETALHTTYPDLVLVGLSAGEAGAEEMLDALATAGFEGKVLLVGGRGAAALAALRHLGERLGLVMLPALGTPFRTQDLIDRVSDMLPPGPAPSLPVEVAEALGHGWLELWYQPKIDPRSLALHSAEALIRMRHPSWGIVPPACFLPAEGDPHFRALSEFVITQAMADWAAFAADYNPVEIAINLPAAVLSEPAFVDDLRSRLPSHPAFNGLTVEINGAEVIRDLALAREIARDLKRFNIAIAIDDLGAGTSPLAALHDFPFVEVKVDRSFVHGCATDRLKRAVCATIVDLGRRFGVRTVAEGVETRADLVAVRDIGFDLVQGFLFAKPMEAKKFARTMLRRRVALPQG